MKPGSLFFESVNYRAFNTRKTKYKCWKGGTLLGGVRAAMHCISLLAPVVQNLVFATPDRGLENGI